jgi:putative membrane protein
MFRFLIRWAINTIAIWLAIELVPGIDHDGSFWSLLGISLIFGLVNALVRPLLVILTCPLVLVTLGLFLLLINAAMLSLTAWISNNVFDLGLFIDGFWPTLLGALIISIVSGVLNMLVSDDNERQRRDARA